VLAGGLLYGLDSAVGAPVGLVCADLETGAVSWRHATRNGSLIVTRDELILLTETGKLVVVTASPAAYEEVLTHELGGGLYWTPPVLWQGRLYCRNVAGRLVCLQPAAKR
jgi:outer membrane protein assembly factor BamB